MTSESISSLIRFMERMGERTAKTSNVAIQFGSRRYPLTRKEPVKPYRKLSEAETNKLREMVISGVSTDRIKAECGVSAPTISRMRKKNEIHIGVGRPLGHSIKEDEANQIVRLYNEGMCVAQIGKKLHRTAITVKKVLDSRKIKFVKRSGFRMDAIKKRKVVEALLNRIPYRKIMQIHGVSKSTLHRYMIKLKQMKKENESKWAKENRAQLEP